MWKQLHKCPLKDPCISLRYGWWQLLHKQFPIASTLLYESGKYTLISATNEQSKFLGSSQRLENIKPLHVWNSVQHFSSHKSSYLKLNFSLMVLLLNSWPTLHSGLFPTSTASAYKWTRNSCSQGLNSYFHSRTSITFHEELLHWAKHQGNVCSNLYHK